ncbi:alkaline phosphatase PhoX [uncultured Oxalicibacterium sp.]|uniref:PhoX family protein n=1 Tax=uncultured Oxalicibacterium sp. TaxID=1168540 RepID=UPI0025F1F65F|nr:alkaline phosphatase PhoX [uncultured Oxalicibacterium sp.]
MSDLPQPSRRQVLQLLAGMPLLPLAGSAALLGGCALARQSDATHVATSFSGMAAPSLENPAAMATNTVGSQMHVHFSDGATRSFRLAYQPFFLTGQYVPDGNGGTILAGGYVDIRNRPIIDRSVHGKERQCFSDGPDGSSLLSVPGAKVKGVNGNTVFAVVQFEYTTRDQLGAQTDKNNAYGTLPSPIAVLTLDQDPATGKLSLVKYHNVDTSQAHGLWITCGASLSPWNTHLSSEEYEPDAQFIEDAPFFKTFSRNLYGDEGRANPYHYGHLPEVTVHADGTGSVTKHYCLGRISHELVQVMPDQRTVLMGDDYTNGGLFLFIADRAADLSAGKLYVAKLDPGFSLDPAAPGAKLRWIRLGHARSDEIEKLADTLKPSDIMTVTKSEPAEPGFMKIYADGIANWVKLKPGMEKAAAFLETHRYANLVGASMGFTKLEGTTVNISDKVAYSALQNIQTSMVRNHPAWRASVNITVDKAVNAGGIFAHDLRGGQRDTDGNAMDSEWIPVRTRALLIGEDMAADALGNLANPDKIANPDNLKFSETMRTLFIGEDSSSHVNNFLWAYNVDTRQLSRLMSVPAGAESTGLHAVDSINGWTYIMSNFQHPGDWSDKLHGKVKAQLDPLIKANYGDRFSAAIGYLTAEPVQPSLMKKTSA